ncbi:MAG TPA: M56 family metallopeptidase [Acidobacteriota bacterium]|nr:M56 family metallopeptidase [Acidobacteriota bacterium]
MSLMDSWMTPETLWRLLDVGVRGGLMVLAAALLVRFAGLSDAASRHRVWTVALAGMLLLVPLGLGLSSGWLVLPLPQWRAVEAPPLAPPQAVPVDSPAGPDFTPAERSAEAPQVLEEPAPTRPAAGGSAETPRQSPWRGAPVVSDWWPGSASQWISLALALYLLGAAVLLGRIVLGLWLRRRLLRRAQPVEDVVALRLALGLAHEADIDPPRLQQSASTCVPFAVPGGIVLPPHWRKWSESQLRSVLAHEIAHLRRRDPYIHLAAWLNRAFYWFNPAAVWVARRLAEQAEEACDALALRWTGQSRRRYAQHLINVAAPLGIRSNRLLIGGIPMARKPHVRRRIEALFQSAQRSAHSSDRPALGWTVLTALFCLLVVSGFRLAALPASPQAQSSSEASQFHMPVPMPQPTPQPTPRPQPMPHFSGSYSFEVGKAAAPKAHAHVHVNPQVDVNVKLSGGSHNHNRWVGARPNDPAFRSRLLRELSSPDAVSRADAAWNSRRLEPSPDLIVALIGVLGDDRPVRSLPSQEGDWDWETTPAAQAAFALGSYGEEAVDALLAVTSDPSDAVRDHALSALALTESERARQPLLRGLSDSSWRVRRSAAWGLGSMEDRSATPALSETLLDAHPQVRRIAAWSLGILEDPDAVGPLAQSLLDDQDAGVREMAAWSLGVGESVDAVEALSQAVYQDSHSEVREVAVWSLGTIESSASVNGLQAALQDSHEGVRDMAVWALGLSRGPEAALALQSVMQDPSPKVRERAAWAMGILERPESIPGLTVALSDENPDVREMAAWALGLVEGRESVPALNSALADPEPQVRETVAWALGIISDRNAVPSLITALQDGDGEVRATAAWALGMIGDARAENELRRLEQASDEPGQVRDTAAWALRMVR